MEGQEMIFGMTVSQVDGKLNIIDYTTRFSEAAFVPVKPKGGQDGNIN